MFKNIGGGTFDAAIVSISSLGMYDVRATSGDTWLGGLNFTNFLVDFCVNHLKGDFFDITANQADMIRLFNVCENAKKLLSTQEQIKISIDWLGDDSYEIPLSRQCFEESIAESVQKTLVCIDCMLKEARIVKENIHDIVLVGGSSRIPIIRSTLKEFFGRNVNTSIDPIQSGKFQLQPHLPIDFMGKETKFRA